MARKLTCLVTMLGIVGCNHNKNNSTPKNADTEITPRITYVSSVDELESVQCSSLSLGGPSCESIASVSKAFEDIAAVSGAAVLTCALFPELVLTKGLAVGFTALGAQSKFTAFILEKIPCDATLSQRQKDEIARQVEAILKSKGIQIEGPISIPDKK